ncbi:MAG: hypothetical protein A2132_05745 [Nitrospirae bacterium RBG_16_43_11]|nr:MAG: hypothetical protein A2132_05745 [Nitrospirae bacterium RBG_16_43_11]
MNMRKNTEIKTADQTGKGGLMNMRKNIIKMMVVAAAAALIIPGAAMADWDQAEEHLNQAEHDSMVNTGTAVHSTGDFNYGMTSEIGYDRFGDGNATLATHRLNNAWGGAPWNTTPCPIQLADPTDPQSWADASGDCPANTSPMSSQTGLVYGEGDNEQYGVILDDLYQEMHETARVEGGPNTLAFKKVDQVVDILFYRSNTGGEVFMQDGWSDNTVANGTRWFGGVGLDQTLDQDIADIEGTTNNPLTTGHSSELWGYDHLAQRFYQDFRMWDRGNTLGTNDVPFSVRSRHGLEMLSICNGDATCANVDADTGAAGIQYTTDEWGDVTLNPEDFGYFDQWVIQSMEDTYDPFYADTDWSGTATLQQSYSSWMVQGQGGDLCNSINQDPLTGDPVGCVYDYNKGDHKVVKSVAGNNSVGGHQTGTDITP